MRNKVIVGNWKMNHTRANALAFVEGMKEEIKVAKSAGFCFGVKRAVETVYKEAAEKNMPIFLI